MQPRIDSRDVLRALNILGRRGQTDMIARLDVQEPMLTEHVTESLSLIHRDILNLGGPAEESQAVYRRIEHLALVCVLAMRPDVERVSDASQEPPST